MVKQAPAFWVSNISNRNVTLSDLALNVPAFRTVNLLDKKHYKYTLEQLEKSRDSGSIYAKRDKIRVRQVAPKIIQPNMPFLKETYIPSRERSILEIKEQHYEELEVGEQQKQDEQYAAETVEDAETANVDGNKPYATKG